MSNQELKQKARAQLGNSLFSNTWMIALLVCFLTSAISGAAGSIIPGIGALLVFGAISYGCDRVFLRQARDGQAMDIGELFTGFTTCFGDTFVLGFLSSLFIALWSLLLVIPGIPQSLLLVDDLLREGRSPRIQLAAVPGRKRGHDERSQDGAVPA